ncbi:MAG: RNA methyltransferase [Candidatus Krumholzibacteriota bacterium]|nr:RNA methyltransferase [Candidatus Krumholzibacteriota bacterium]
MDTGDTLRITSAQNERLKAAAALRKRRERDRTGLTLVEGYREIERAVRAGVGIVEIFLGPGADEDAAVASLASRLAAAGAPTCAVASRAWDKLAVREGTVPIVVVARVPERGLGTLSDAAGPGETPLYLVADRVEKPGNVGAILRSADGAGITGLVVSDGATDLFNPNVVRASIGTVFTVPAAACTATDAIGWLRSRGARIVVAALAGGAVPYSAVDYTGPTAIVVGSEETGVGPDWLHAADEIVRIPMRGAADSLNVSISAAVLLFEARRQRGQRAD